MINKLKHGCCITAVMPPDSRRVSVTYAGKRRDIEETFLFLCYELVSSGAITSSSLLSSAMTVSHTMLQAESKA